MLPLPFHTRQVASLEQGTTEDTLRLFPFSLDTWHVLGDTFRSPFYTRSSSKTKYFEWTVVVVT